MLRFVPLLAALAAYGQTPAFEVASVKPNPSCTSGRPMGRRPTPGRLAIECTTLHDLVQGAYVVFANGASPNLRETEITGGPAWFRTEFYSVNAKAADAAPLSVMLGPMLRALLEERFQLKLHHEAKEAPVYLLTAPAGAAKLKATAEGGCLVADLDHLPPPATPGQPAPSLCGNQRMRGNGRSFHLTSNGATLHLFAEQILTNLLDRPVVDKTGLAGRFDFDFDFAPDASLKMYQAVPNAPEPDGPTLPIVLERLGLHLERGKSAVDTIVIDRAERPAEN
jgi:uncharacterized protein (TIGR03435 family)